MLQSLLISALFMVLCRDESDVLPDYRYPHVTLADAHRFRHVTRAEARYHTQAACANARKRSEDVNFNFAAYVDAGWRYDIWNHVENVLYIYQDRSIRLRSLDSLRRLLGDDFYAGVVPASVPD